MLVSDIHTSHVKVVLIDIAWDFELCSWSALLKWFTGVYSVSRGSLWSLSLSCDYISDLINGVNSAERKHRVIINPTKA